MITVQADANKLIFNNEAAEEMIIDGNDDPLMYLTDALAAVALVVAYAELKYGPIITDTLLASMEDGKLRRAIDEKRKEKTE